MQARSASEGIRLAESVKGCPCAVFTKNIASCDFFLADLRRLVLTRPAVFTKNIASCDFFLADLRRLVLTRPAVFTKNIASCDFFLAALRRLVLTRPSGPSAEA
jgi:hypothetical protein